jgi:hypothetical protein
VQTGCSVNTRNPQCTKLAFTLASVTVGILPGFRDSLVGSFKQPAAGSIVALGQLKDFFMASLTGYASFNSRHFSATP